MTERPTLAPSLTCQDIDKTYDYFTSVLGFAGHGKWAGPNGATMHASVLFPTADGAANIFLGPLDAVVSGEFGDAGAFAENLKNSPDTLGNGISLFVNVPNVDEYFAFIKKNGALIDAEPTDQFWGDRTCTVRTPDGYYLTFASPIEDFEVPEGMGPADGVGAVQATAPGTQSIELPGA